MKTTKIKSPCVHFNNGPAQRVLALGKSRKAAVMAAAGLLTILVLCGNAQATIVSSGPFTGTWSETWEGFSNGGPLSDPTPIMGGNAMIANGIMTIYEPGVADFFLGTGGGTAQTSDGIKGMGLDDQNQSAMISFIGGNVYSFGAYWGAGAVGESLTTGLNLEPGPKLRTVTLTFSDGSTVSFDYLDATGALEWHGWSSDVALSGVTYSGNFVAIDGLQADITPVPEASTWFAGIGASLAMLTAFARKGRK